MKRVLCCITALIFTLACASCAGGLFPDSQTPVPTFAPTEAPISPSPVQEPTPTPYDVNAYAAKCVEKASKTLEKVVSYISKHPIPFESGYHRYVPVNRRAALSPEEQELYDKMLSAAKEFGDLELSCEDGAMENALNALLADRPEIEICFTMKKDKDGNGKPVWRTLYFLPEGNRIREAKDLNKVREQVNAFIAVGAYVGSHIPKEFSVIDRYRTIAGFICLTSQYCYVHGTVPPYATGAYGALINGYSICQGYTLGFEYLCSRANLDCRRVRNEYNDDNMHFWDIVTLDPGTYYVDVTWCDGTADLEYAEWFKWFMFTSDDQHVADDGTVTTGFPLDRDSWPYLYSYEG